MTVPRELIVHAFTELMNEVGYEFEVGEDFEEKLQDLVNLIVAEISNLKKLIQIFIAMFDPQGKILLKLPRPLAAEQKIIHNRLLQGISSPPPKIGVLMEGLYQGNLTPDLNALSPAEKCTIIASAYACVFVSKLTAEMRGDIEKIKRAMIRIVCLGICYLLGAQYAANDLKGMNSILEDIADMLYVVLNGVQ